MGYSPAIVKVCGGYYEIGREVGYIKRHEEDRGLARSGIFAVCERREVSEKREFQETRPQKIMLVTAVGCRVSH